MKPCAYTPRPSVRIVACGALIAAVGAAAQAVPVEVAIDGLPAGLAPVLAIQRNICNDGETWLRNPSQRLTARSWVVYDPVAQPSGQITIVPRTVTRYSASFDTPASPQSPVEIRCSANGHLDLFRFHLSIPGYDADGTATSIGRFLSDTLQTAPVQVSAAMSARSTWLLPTPYTYNRGQLFGINVHYSASIGSVVGARLDLLRPSSSALAGTSYERVASLYKGKDGKPCLQVGSVTQCKSSTTPFPEAGGVKFWGVGTTSNPGERIYQIELSPQFPAGPLRLRNSADASDLDSYLVNGMPTALDLLPWQGSERDVAVQ